MDVCPHCGSPGSFADATNGRCPVCGMALPSEVETSEKSTSAAPGPVGAGTLQPSSVSSGETATIAFQPQPPDPDDTNSPKGIDLIKPRELSPEYARRVTAAWQNTRSQFIDPKETIKSEKAGVFEMGDLNIGSRVVGGVEDLGTKDYELKEVIGEGAMGTVWSARQSSLNRDVAIKMPRGSAKTDAGRRQFMSEVVVTGQLDHPNIVPIYDLGKDGEGELFYSMKRVEGRPWNELLQNEDLTLQENLEILMKVCDAIRFAHDRGVIHRDIKPHNIMVGQYGEVAVMDWGIALRLDGGTPHSSITRISPAGTPAYMAPEMATGSAGAIGPATDVYLLGAVLYEILTREPPHPPPYDSKNYQEILNDALLIAARNEIPPIRPGGELADIAYKALATEVENRYQSVREFQDAVREYHSHAESINLTERGEKLLARAQANGHATHNGSARFDDFDRARFAFEEAIQIWPGNRSAHKMQAQAILAYANYAYEEGAYARGIALLSESNPNHTDLLKKLKAARRRTNSLSFLLKAAALLIIVGGTIFSIAVYSLWTRAEKEKDRAVVARNDAVAAQKAEEAAKNKAVNAQKAEEIAKNKALDSQKAEEAAKNKALDAQRAEEIAKNRALDAQKAEEIAKNAAVAAQSEAQRSSYAFEIGLAAEELQRNAFDRAREILTSQANSAAKRPLRNWEWGFLESLVNLDAKSFGDNGKTLRERVEATAISQDQKWIAAGTNEGYVYVWQFDRNEQPVKLHYGKSVNSVAITRDGSLLLAAGRSSGDRHAVKIWSLPARDGAKPDRELAAHGAPLLSLDISQDSSTLLVGAADGKVILSRLDGTTDPISFVATSQENSIWSARFSADGRWIITAGEDGTVRVWNTELEPNASGSIREARRFVGGKGAVYTAAFAANGQYVVSGGSDGHLLAWEFDADAAVSTAFSPAGPAQESLSNPSDVPQRSSAIPLGNHDADVRSISFSADGRILFTAGHDHTIRVWNMADGLDNVHLVKTLRGHGGWVRSCVALANDSSSVLSGGYDRRVQIWNWENYSFPRVLRYESSRSLGDLPLTAAAATPDGQWVATASQTGVITIWDLQNPLQPKPQELAEGHDWQATTAIYFGEGRRLLTAGGDNTALIWDEEHGNEMVRIGGWFTESGAGWRGVAAVSSDGRRIATGAQGDILARIWDAESGKLIAEIAAANSQSLSAEEKREATALAFAPDGETLLVGDQWGTCYTSHAEDSWRGSAFQAHPSKISGIEFLPDGQGFLTASYDGTVQQWIIKSVQPEPQATYRHADRVVAMDLDSDGRTFITAAGSDDEQAILRIWDRAQADSPTHSLRLSDINGNHLAADGKKTLVRSVSLHPSESRALVTIFDPITSNYRIGSWTWTKPTSPYQLISGSGLRDLSTAVFAPHRGEAILTVGGRGARLQSLGTKVMPVSMSYRPQSAINSVSFSADGRRLISASEDGTLKVWLLDSAERTWKPEARLVGQHRHAINRVVFHPGDSNSFLTGSDDGTAKLWRLRGETWEPVRTLGYPDGQPVLDVAFVGGEGHITAAGPIGVYLWDAQETPRRVADIESAQRVTPSPDSRWLVVASGSQARLVNAATLQTMPAVLTGHSAEITAVAFTPDGTRLFTTSSDFTAKLWDAQAMVTAANGTSQQRELLTLEGHADEVTSVAVGVARAPFVVTTGLDGQAIVWPNEPVE